MNILYVTTQIPCKRTGGQVRQFHLIRELSHWHQITVISFLRSEEEAELKALEEFGVKYLAIPFSQPAREQGWENRWKSWKQAIFDPRPHYASIYPVERLLPALEQAIAQRTWDVVNFEYLDTAPLSTAIGDHSWILTAHNVESLNASSQAEMEPKATHRLKARIEASKLRRWERKWVESSTACLTVSELDARRLRQLAPKGKFCVIPNGVDSKAFEPDPHNTRHKNRIVFFGNLAYPPNRTGLRWFIERVFLQLRESIPDVSLEIIGPHAAGEILEYGEYPGVKIVGFVEDIRPHLWDAELCIVPLFSGGGTRLKILEAAAAGCAVVSTSLGAEGLELAGGIEFLMADNPQDFNLKIKDLLENPDLLAKITRNALEAVKKRYDWCTIAHELDQVYSCMVNSEKATPV